MWLSEKLSVGALYSIPTIGEVTLSGDTTAVMTDKENRDTVIASPGGYVWKPMLEDTAISLMTNEEKTAILGTVVTENVTPGEVKIVSHGGAYILLKNDGTVYIHGDIYHDGEIIQTEDANGT